MNVVCPIFHPLFTLSPSPFFDLDHEGDVTVDAVTSSEATSLAQIAALEKRAAAMARTSHLDTQEQEVITAPVFVTRPKSDAYSVEEGRNAHFEAKLEPITDPNLQVEWLRDGEPITVGHRFRPVHDFGYVALDIVGAIEEDTGVYTCRATNLAGQAEFSLRLDCKSKASFCFLFGLTTFYSFGVRSFS